MLSRRPVEALGTSGMECLRALRGHRRAACERGADGLCVPHGGCTRRRRIPRRGKERASRPRLQAQHRTRDAVVGSKQPRCLRPVRDRFDLHVTEDLYPKVEAMKSLAGGTRTPHLSTAVVHTLVPGPAMDLSDRLCSRVHIDIVAAPGLAWKGRREGGVNPPRPRHCNRGRNPHTPLTRRGLGRRGE